VQGDKQILEMVLYHLLDNALDACLDSDRREVELRGTALADGRIEICVADTGPTPNEEQIARMTHLEYTTKSHGTGYGLHWVERRVKDMQGGFSLRPGTARRGTEAVVVLPAAGTAEVAK